MKIIYLIGLPCSGKSTFLAKHYSDYVLVSNDAIVEKYAKEQNLKYNDVWGKINFADVNDQCRLIFEEAVAQRKSIVIDNTNMTAKARRKYRANGYDYKAIVFMISEKERQRRVEKRRNEIGKFVPQDAIDNMNKIFQMPTKDEGFSEIITIKE